MRSTQLGGVCQVFLVIYLRCRRDFRLISLPPPIQILLLFLTPILLGPVVVNLYGAYFVFRQKNIHSIEEDVTR